MTVPYAPTPFATPIINPRVGGFGLPYPYISVSQYRFAPTAMDTENLVPDGDEAAQTQALADTIRRQSSEMDIYCFGADPAAKGASLCATQTVDAAYVKILGGELRLVCDYHPIMELDSLAVGVDPSSMTPIDQSAAARIRFGVTTIFLPSTALLVSGNGPAPLIPTFRTLNNRVYVIWSYISGYAHTILAESADAGDTSIIVAPTTPSGGLCGTYPGTQFRISDGELTEIVTVESITGTTVSLVSPLAHAHTVPDSPDFIPVTTLPSSVEEAAILLTTAGIKSRGDEGLILSEVDQADREAKGNYDNGAEDTARAWEKLDPFRSVTKVKS